MSAEECKGYACPPSTTVDLPECEHGWELGNNTAVCATDVPPPLAATGADGASLAIGVVLGLAVGIIGLTLTRWSSWLSSR